METIIGYIAAFFTTFAMMPQVIRIWRLKEARDISLWMPMMILTGSLLWLVYGILIKQMPVVIANVVSFLISLFTLLTSIKYR
ncbi:MAG TPA: SemiSWEET transporter [Syntrophorhabdaceae bacterium]|nr:SemiSWEET transporter [Syntrophorhabdaceae bacterium]HOT41561.1 SemiSWEET transporter [Syntrophorhabdaceae bacterium]HPC65859.1 SemiSWEET transporter [Syntrophorhabdaceae bacterium]HQE79515.1 SemiSWEET transporter [Syntrophorhabdaceae bacterium]HQH43078.1 SemiSWEET transporter [Syntrophorhabdaceae bacterium]